VGQTGRNRTINRQKLARAQIEEELADPGSCRAQVYRRLTALFRARAASAAFGPIAEQQILDCGDAVFGVLRFTADDTAWAVCLHNLTGRGQSVDLGSFRRGEGEPWVEILTGGIRAPEERERLDLQPYEVRWFASARAPGAEDGGPPDAASEANDEVSGRKRCESGGLPYLQLLKTGSGWTERPSASAARACWLPKPMTIYAYAWLSAGSNARAS
jgi:hypothetical protein